MPWSAPLFSGGVVWEDYPSIHTPLNASDLNTEENAEAMYSAAVGQSVVNYFENGLSGSVPNASELSPGNLGPAYTVDFGNKPNQLIMLTGTLNANCTLTFANRAPGCRAILLLVQDATGGRTLSVSDGATTQALAITSTSNSQVGIEVDCPNAVDIYVNTLGSPGLPSSVVNLGSATPATNPTPLPTGAGTQNGTVFFNVLTDSAQGSHVAGLSMFAAAALFNSQTDPTIGWGYNVNAIGFPLDTTEPMGKWQIEGHWNTGTQHILETYFEVKSADSSISWRPFYITVDRVANQATTFHCKSNTYNFDVDQGAGASALMVQIAANNYDIFAPTATVDNVLTLHAANGHYGALVLYDGTNGADAQFCKITPQGNQLLLSVQDSLNVNHTILKLFGIASAGGRAAINSSSNGAGLTIAADVDTTPVLVLRPHSATQSGRMWTVQDSGNVDRVFVGPKFSLVVGNTALATNATDGFLYLPTCAGAPTGVPTAWTGTAPAVYDTTDNKLYIYNSGWKAATFA